MRYVALLRLELHKQRSALLGVAILAVCALVAGIVLLARTGHFEELRSVCSAVAGFSATMACVFLGISGGQGLRKGLAGAEEDAFPVQPSARVIAAYSAGLMYAAMFLIPVLMLYGIPNDDGLIGLKAGGLLWIATTLFKVHLISFMSGCWLKQGPVAAFVALAVAYVEAMCSLSLWRIQDYFNQPIELFVGSQYLIPGRILMDLLMLIFVLYTCSRLMLRFYGKKEGFMIPNVLLPVSSLLFGPAASWFIFSFLMTAEMHEAYHWNFSAVVLFEAAHALGLS